MGKSMITGLTIYREETDSSLDLCRTRILQLLGENLSADDLEEFMEKYFPGWEVIHIYQYSG